MHQTRADLDKKRAEVSAMFDGVAERYDLLNSLLSMGRDRGWRSVEWKNLTGGRVALHRAWK